MAAAVGRSAKARGAQRWRPAAAAGSAAGGRRGEAARGVQLGRLAAAQHKFRGLCCHDKRHAAPPRQLVALAGCPADAAAATAVVPTPQYNEENGITPPARPPREPREPRAGGRGRGRGRGAPAAEGAEGEEAVQSSGLQVRRVALLRKGCLWLQRAAAQNSISKEGPAR